MVTRKRWNSQRFLDRIPVAELEYKMVLYRKDNDRLDREHRMKKVELWNTLFRNEIDREKSVVKYHSLNEVLDGRVELTVDHKKSKETRDSFQLNKQLEAFKHKTASRLHVSVNDGIWNEPRTLNYDDRKRDAQRPLQLIAANSTSIDQLLSDSYDIGQNHAAMIRLPDQLSPEAVEKDLWLRLGSRIVFAVATSDNGEAMIRHSATTTQEPIHRNLERKQLVSGDADRAPDIVASSSEQRALTSGEKLRRCSGYERTAPDIGVGWLEKEIKESGKNTRLPVVEMVATRKPSSTERQMSSPTNRSLFYGQLPRIVKQC